MTENDVQSLVHRRNLHQKIEVHLQSMIDCDLAAARRDAEAVRYRQQVQESAAQVLQLYAELALLTATEPFNIVNPPPPGRPCECGERGVI